MMKPASFKDHFSAHASAYTRYRPGYPEALFVYLASLSPVRDLACEACGHTVRAIKPWGRCHLYCDETCWVTGPVNDRREARREKKLAELKRRKAARTGDRKRHPRHGLSRARGSPPTWGAYRGSDDGGHGTARRATRPGT